MQYVYNSIKQRRAVLKSIAGGIAGLAAFRLGWSSTPKLLPHLTDANPAAASLEYTEDTNTVDARKFPKHTPDQRCANCKYFDIGAIAGGPYAPCRLYPGNAVNMSGWCAGYASK